uniref:Uncharacterized protein n=1 Tax=Lactuca sativa TaxID=4236 RepID=A0A9R1W6Q6_LACSA|nr:hypothetical protein LSAT_V11C300117560 [Lactuca sativa]
MTYVNRVWMAAGVAVVNGHTDQSYKLKSLLINSFRHGKKAFTSDLRPLSGLLISDTRRQHSPMSLSGKSCTLTAGAKAEDWFVLSVWEAFSTDEESMMRVNSWWGCGSEGVIS